MSYDQDVTPEKAAAWLADMQGVRTPSRTALARKVVEQAERLRVYEEPWRVQPPGGSLRPMRSTCACGTTPDPGVCSGCALIRHSHCACMHKKGDRG